MLVELEGYTVFGFKKEKCDVYFKGNISVDGQVISLEKWIASLVAHLQADELGFCSYLSSELASISGLFSLLIQQENNFYLAADLARSMPLNYGFKEGKLFITNRLDKYLVKQEAFPIDQDRLEELISAGSVLESGTIYENIYGIQAGEIVSIRGGELSSERYFQFIPEANPDHSDDADLFARDLDKALLKSFTNMIQQTPHVNRWLVSLSGGHDSRIIVNYLYRLGIKNVVCYTYGKPGNQQAVISKQVAEALGYEWHFVEYTDQKWNELHENGSIDQYIDFAFNGVSLTHFQDFLAIYELRKNEIIMQGDVFVPGHTFDWLAGSNYNEQDMACENRQMALERVIFKHLRSRDVSRLPVRTIENIYEKANVSPRYFQEYYNWQERRSKYMVNSVRAYELFGHEFRLPFWDREIVEFCRRIPDNDRMGRAKYLEAETRGILVDLLVDLPYAGKVDRSGRNSITDLVSRILSGPVKTVLLKFSRRKLKLNEGLNLIYTLKAHTLRDMLEPIEDYPPQILRYFEVFLDRYPYQVNYELLTALYSIRRVYDRAKYSGGSF